MNINWFKGSEYFKLTPVKDGNKDENRLRYLFVRGGLNLRLSLLIDIYREQGFDSVIIMRSLDKQEREVVLWK